MQNTKLTPTTLLSTIAISNLLLSAGFGSILVFSAAKTYDWHTDLPSRLPSLLIILFAFVASLAAEHLLRKGIRQQRWTEHQLAPARKFCRSPLLLVLIASLAAAALLTFILNRQPHSNAILWTFMAPLLSFTRLPSLFPRKDDTEFGLTSMRPSSARPSTSEHRGA